MSLAHSPSIVRTGLVFAVDAKNVKSYPGTGTIWSEMTKGYNVTLNASSTFDGKAHQFRNSSNMFASAIFDEGVLRSSNQTGQWTIEIWFKHVAATSVSECILAGRSGCHGGIYLNADNILYHAIKTTNGNCWIGANSTAVASLSTGQYYHSVFTYNNGACSHYQNGALVAQSTFDNVANTMTGYGTEFLIGGVSGRMTNSDISIVNCYNIALSSMDVAQNFAAHRGRFGL